MDHEMGTNHDVYNVGVSDIPVMTDSNCDAGRTNPILINTQASQETESSSSDAERAYICNYLSSHPQFARDWFLKNATNELIQEWLVLRSGRLQSPCETWSLKSYSELKSNEAQQIQQNNEEKLTASYAEIARGGRNSVTTELFNEIIVGGPSRRRKKSSIIPPG